MKKGVIVGIFTALIATFLMSHNAFALNGWNVIQTIDMNTSGLSGASNPLNQSWFTPVRYYPNSNQGSYSRLYNPVLYVSGNAMTVSKGQKFRIYLYGNVYTESYMDNGLDTIETDALVRYTGNFVCTDDDFILAPNNSGAFQQSIGSTLDYYSLQYTFVHKLDCYATADNLQLHNLKLGGNLVKYNTTYLGGNEFFDFDFSGKIVAYDDLEYEALKVIERDISSIKTNISSIKTNTDDIADDVSAILNNSNTSAQKDAQDMQGFQNMQNTDGLVDVGDNSNFMSSFNAVNNFLGGVKNATPTNCVINADLGNLDLGELDFCQLPNEIKTVIQTVAGFVFAVFDFLILWNSIKYIIGVINWARSN